MRRILVVSLLAFVGIVTTANAASADPLDDVAQILNETSGLLLDKLSYG